jgi:hypothetical protein
MQAPPPNPFGGSSSPSALPGRLTPGWQLALGAAWAGVVIGLVVISVTSDQVGLSVWWRGPQSARVGPLLMLVPFIAPIAACTVAARNMRWAAPIGVAAALATGAVALGDIGRVPGFAAAEGLLAACGLLVSVGAFSGTYRASAAEN